MNNNTVIAIIVGALLVIAAAAFFFGGAGSSKVALGDYDTFAQCLDDAGMRMYGSATCHFCAQQRAMFGSSFEYINEIECDPRNPGAQVDLCIAKNIEGTPTWILEDGEGNDVQRFPAGVMTFEQLSEASGCPLVKDSELEIESGADNAEEE